LAAASRNGRSKVLVTVQRIAPGRTSTLAVNPGGTAK
jgi:hypothetical protein